MTMESRSQFFAGDEIPPSRYISIYKPTHFQRIHTFKNASIHITLSFVAGILLHIPLCFQNKVGLFTNLVTLVDL